MAGDTLHWIILVLVIINLLATVFGVYRRVP